MKPLITSTTVTFSQPREEIRLEEDRERAVEPTRYGDLSRYSVATDKRYVRMYHKRELSPIVTAITGVLAEAGKATHLNTTELVATTPESPAASVPGWAINVRLTPVGKAIDADGNITQVTWFYDPVRLSVIPSKAVYGVVRITYDAPYTLFLYTFSGACPAVPPSQFDAEGNAIAQDTSDSFSAGLLYAIDYDKEVSAYLNMTPPECRWPTGGQDRDTRVEGAKQIPVMQLEQDPEYPPAFSRRGKELICETVVRAFPAGYARDVYATEGWLYSHEHKGGMDVEEMLIFTMESSKSLKYLPDGDVHLRVIRVFEAPFGFSSSFNADRGFIGPGGTVVDVEEGESSDEEASNPRPRTVGEMEVVAVGAFRRPVKVIAVVRASYVARYDSYVYRFDYDDRVKEFKSGTIIAVDSQDRTATLRLSGPSMKSRSRSLLG